MKVARRRIVAMGSQAATAANRKFHTSHDCRVSCAPQRGVLRGNRIPTFVSGKPAVSLPTSQIRFRSPRRNNPGTALLTPCVSSMQRQQWIRRTACRDLHGNARCRFVRRAGGDAGARALRPRRCRSRATADGRPPASMKGRYRASQTGCQLSDGDFARPTGAGDP